MFTLREYLLTDSVIWLNSTCRDLAKSAFHHAVKDARIYLVRSVVRAVEGGVYRYKEGLREVQTARLVFLRGRSRDGRVEVRGPVGAAETASRGPDEDTAGVHQRDDQGVQEAAVGGNTSRLGPRGPKARGVQKRAVYTAVVYRLSGYNSVRPEGAPVRSALQYAYHCSDNRVRLVYAVIGLARYGLFRRVAYPRGRR